MIYLDNAATSYPKPEGVYVACDRSLRSAANPGRGGHRLSRAAARLVFDAREQVASFFGITESRRLIFTGGATDSLNMVLGGLDFPRRRIIACGFEHNSLWRPLEHLRLRQGIEVIYLDLVTPSGVEWEKFDAALELGADLVVITHASNITGHIYPVEEVAIRAHGSGALVCVDASQTAGVVPMNFCKMNLDFVAFPGHKGLMGPPGVGGLYVKTGLDLHPTRLGGTGGHSESATQPQAYPERLESGTLNLPGIAGLSAGVAWNSQKGIEVLAHELSLRGRAVEGLAALGAIIYSMPVPSVGVISFNLPRVGSTEVAHMLDDAFSIAVRGGLHCCPRGHQSLGTLEQGAVRVSPGAYNTLADIDKLLQSVQSIKDMMR